MESEDEPGDRSNANAPLQSADMQSNLVVQPVLVSTTPPQGSSSAPAPARARAPPSLIPISSFANQFNPPLQHQRPIQQSTGVLRLATAAQQHQQQCLIEDDARDVDDDDDGEDWVKNQRIKYPASTAQLVSTSSHSVVSGVKLHIHRAPASQSARTIPEPMDYSEESEESTGVADASSSDNLSSILNAIRSNTSLTIEEVTVKPTSTLEANLSRRSEEFARSGGGSNDKVEVFIVPQTNKAPQVFSTPSPFSGQKRAGRGRPRRVYATPTPAYRNEVPDSQEIGGSRRTARDRKPTKHFTPDFSRFRGFKKRMEMEAARSEEAWSPAVVDGDAAEEESETVEDGVGVIDVDIKPVVKRRGRPSTGRGRGRPRGSTSKKPKPETAPDGTTKSEEASETGKAPEVSHPTDVDNSDVIRQTVKTPRGIRTARGGRGGKRITKAMKIQKAKLKKLLSKRKDSLQLFEEETRMSSDVKPGLSSIVQTVPPNVEREEDASNSTNTSTTTKQKKQTKGQEIEEQKPVTADTLFEYHWPVDDPLAEIFFLQEQVSEYLGVKSFKRKYPDLKRRTVEMAERDYLRGQKIVSETQCDLGLTALQSNHVLEIMFNDFPDKYEEYRRVVQERRDKEYMKQKTQQSTTTTQGRDKGAEFLKRILNSTATWNSNLNRQRTEERSCCFDQQTCTMNIQRSKMKVLPPHATKMGYYPVSVLPGQFTDGYTKYSADELKYLPLNTVSFGPVIENHFNNAGSDNSSDSDDSSSSSGDSSSSSDSDEKDGSDGPDRRSSNNGNSAGITTFVVGENGTAGIQSISCKTCEGDVHKNKDGQFEVLIQCTKCEVANHPTCLELSLDMLPFIKKYNWQCTDCKNCIECNDPADEDKMLFCDLCDRGYHIYCVGLRKVPTGRWHCRICSVCFSCGATKQANDERPTEWHHEFKKAEKGSKIYSHSICTNCHKLHKKGQYCPTCNKSHLKIDDKSLLECRSCEKLIHKDCVRRQHQTVAGILCEPCDSANKGKSRNVKDSFVKQNFYFY